MSILSKIDTQMNNILSVIKQIPKSSNKTCPSHLILYENKNANSNNSSLVLQDNQSDLITYENFPFSHLCNRDVYFILFLYFYKRNLILRYVIYHYQNEILMI
jgi:hypothetical protein